MREIIMDVLSAIAVALVITALYTVVSEVQAFLKAQIAKLKGNEKFQDNIILQDSFRFAEKFLDGLVKASVSAMEQTKARDLRARVKKGFASKEDLQALAVEVREGVKAALTPAASAQLQSYITDLDRYIDTKIESSVRELKTSDLVSSLYSMGAGSEDPTLEITED